jgi:hypothetical protein
MSSRILLFFATTLFFFESRNAPFIKEGCGKRARFLENEKCENSWCLHVSLFELNLPANLRPSDLPTIGQQNCSPNLKWLTP